MKSMLLSVLLGPWLAMSACQHTNDKEADAQSASLSLAAPAAEDDVVAAGRDSLLSLCLYAADDSMRVEALLRQDVGANDVLHYARQFLGVPYVGGTLEQADTERLVVNLRQLDCTTLVETVGALALTKRQGSERFSDYCANLMRLRYWHGRMDGYLSRLHYFTWWMHDNMDKGLLAEVTDSLHCTAPIRVNNHYMSAHPDRYRFLKAHPEWVDSIARMEQRYNGDDGFYLPEAATGLDRKDLGFVRDGDLVAIVTSKAGLDYSHLGFAVWGSDGRLHLLNASSIHHKVVEEPKTLRQYLREHPTSVGVRVFRLVTS